MTTNRHPISIGGVTFWPHQQHSENAAWIRALASAHGKEITFCLCTKSRPVRLTVKHYAQSKVGLYGLARWPGTNWDHDPGCRFFCEDLEGGSSDRSLPAYEELEDGRIRAYLARSLTVATTSEDVAALSGDTLTRSGRTRARASDTEMLYRLWREANLNIYRGKRTPWFLASLRAMHSARRFVVARNHRTLADHLLLGTTERCQTAIAHNDAVLTHAVNAKSRLYVLGRMKVPTAAQLAKTAFLLPLMDHERLPKIMVRRALFERLLHGRPLMASALADSSAHVVVLCCIQPNGGDWWTCTDITGFVVSRSMIPIESSYEGVMERHLVSQGRHFVKPLHFNDLNAGENLRPDFMLLDTHPRCLIEVWGSTTPEYLEMKKKRLLIYRSKKLAVLSWEAHRNQLLPALPTKTE